jgi:glycosyltransferase involved in cell wall biosynthesis
MKILAFASNQSSPGYHRIILPFGLIPGPDVHVTNNLTEDLFDDIDFFVYNRIMDEKHINKIYKFRKKKNFKIVVDVDDWWYLDEHHNLYKHYQEVDFAKHQINQLTKADVVFVTHTRLADAAMVHNKNVHVLPNAIPRFGQFIKYRRTPSKYCRVFWQGSNTHLYDILLLSEVFRNLPDSDFMQMVMAGYEEKNIIWRQMSMIYTDSGRLKNKIVDALHFTNYYQAYQEADLCLVPLVNSAFNRMKSNLKVLEAAHSGLPVICFNIDPYKDLPVVYAKSTRDWITNIKRFSTSSKRRQDYGLALQDYCNINFNFNKINLQRKQILEHESR